MKSILVITILLFRFVSFGQTVDTENQRLKRKVDSLQAIVDDYRQKFDFDTVFYVETPRGIQMAKDEVEVFAIVEKFSAEIGNDIYEVMIYEMHLKDKTPLKLLVYPYEEVDAWMGQNFEFDETENTIRFSHFHGWYNESCGDEGEFNFETEWQFLNGELWNYEKATMYDGKSYIEPERLKFKEETGIDAAAMSTTENVLRFFNLNLH